MSTRTEHRRTETFQRAKGCRIINRGDQMRVLLPGDKTSSLVTFRAVVEPEGKEPYLEVIASGRYRFIRFDAVRGGGK